MLGSSTRGSRERLREELMVDSRRRRGARARLTHRAFFESGKHQGSATLVVISYSGARLQVEQEAPPVGEAVRLYVWPPNQPEPFELVGHVVGLRDDGFTVEFEEPGQAVCQWIDALQISEAPPPASAA